MTSNSMRRAKTLWQKLRLDGPSGLRDTLKYNLYRNVRTARLRLSVNSWQPRVAVPSGLEVRRGSLIELSKMRARYARNSLGHAFYADLLYGLDRFYLGFWRQQIVHISWLSQRVCSVGIPLLPDEADVRDVQTLPPFRGLGIAKNVLQHLLLDIRDEPISTVYAHVSVLNKPYLKVCFDTGFETESMLQETRILGFDRVRRVVDSQTTGE